MYVLTYFYRERYNGMLKEDEVHAWMTSWLSHKEMLWVSYALVVRTLH